MSTGKIIAIVGFILLIAAGIWAGLPLVVDKQVDEDLPGGLEELPPVVVQTPPVDEMPGTAMQATNAPEDTTRVLGTGQFTGFDSVHQASGTARVIEVEGKSYVRFENDFTVTNGPDLYVYFGNNGKYDAGANLGRLKGNQGSQNYEIPSSIDPAAYNEVWVWCRAFSVPFGKAPLQ